MLRLWAEPAEIRNKIFTPLNMIYYLCNCSYHSCNGNLFIVRILRCVRLLRCSSWLKIAGSECLTLILKDEKLKTTIFGLRLPVGQC